MSASSDSYSLDKVLDLVGIGGTARSKCSEIISLSMNVIGWQ